MENKVCSCGLAPCRVVSIITPIGTFNRTRQSIEKAEPQSHPRPVGLLRTEVKNIGIMWKTVYERKHRLNVPVRRAAMADLTCSTRIGHKRPKEANQNMFIDKNTTMSSTEDQSH